MEVSDDFVGVGIVPVRDSKRSRGLVSGPALLFPAASWSAFVESVKH